MAGTWPDVNPQAADNSAPAKNSGLLRPADSCTRIRVMADHNPTSRDIAEAAGVSQATVSRALRNSPLVRKETRDRIHRIARELNYIVNRNAAGLRTRLSNTLALLLFDEGRKAETEINPFFLSMIGSITRAASNLGYDVLVSSQHLENDWHIEYKVSNRADGLILLGYGDYVAYREKLAALAEARTQFIIWGPIVEDQPGHSLGCDNESGTYQATQHLAGLGRKKIAFLGSTSEANPELRARHRGYVQALSQSGLPRIEALHIQVDNGEQLGFEAAGKLLRCGESFDAILAATDQIAIGAMRALAVNGVRVPEDVSVVGFDDLPVASYVSPALTTMQQNTRIAGQLLVDKLVHLIEGNEVESQLIAPRLIVRDSCGATRLR